MTSAPTADTTHVETADDRFIGGNKHNAKYDRQLRLWGKEGQQALADAHVVAVGVSASVVEALKSIVLTGVHAFTLADDALVSKEDIATNFFVLPSDEGQSVAVVTARHLAELNSDCVALAVCADPAVWVNQFMDATHAKTPSEVRQRVQALVDTATVVANGAATDHRVDAGRSVSGASVGAPSLLLVSQRYADHSEESALVTSAKEAPGAPPVLCVQTRGLMGFYQAFAHHDRVIAMPHPSQNELVSDLRMFNPFPTLKTWFDAHDPSNPDQLAEDIVAHSHIPYPSIVYRAYIRWCADKGEAAPQPPLKGPQYAELKRLIWHMSRRKEPPQESFVEAAEKCSTVLNRPYLPHASQSLVRLWEQKAAVAPTIPRLPNHEEGRTIAQERAGVEQVLAWYIIAAIREFAVAHSPADKSYLVLPQNGHLPDFNATTQFFQELREIYQQKHMEDAEDVAHRAWKSLNESEENRAALRGYPEKGSEVQALVQHMAKTMVQNVWHLSVVPFASSGEEHDGCGARSTTREERLGKRMATHVSGDAFEGVVLAMLAAVALDTQADGSPLRTTKATCDDDIAASASVLENTISSVLAAATPPDPTAHRELRWPAEYGPAVRMACEELARVGAVQVPSVAATMGALASQEAIKLIQHRRVPVHDPIVYSGYTNTLHTLTLS